MEISSVKKNAAIIAAGQWVDDIPNMGDVRLKVCGLSSPAAIALRGRLERAVPPDQRERDGSLKPAAGMAVLKEVLHKAVLQDWDNITDGGKPVPYDADLAHRWLTDPDFENFADAVVWAARVVDRGVTETEAVITKNSETPSAGGSKPAKRSTGS